MPASERQEVSAEQYEVLKAVLGVDADTFRRTNLGQYIFDRVAMQEENLIEELIEAAAKSTDMNLVRISLDIAMQRMLPKFIDEAVSAGHGAEENIGQMEAASTED